MNFSVPKFDTKEFQIPIAAHSLVFDIHVTRFLGDITRTVERERGVAVITGSAALLEACHTEDSKGQESLNHTPNDVDVFIHLRPPFISCGDFDRSLKCFVTKLGENTMMEFHVTRSDSWNADMYRIRYGNSIEMWGILDLKFYSSNNVVHPKKIQLIFVYHFRDPEKSWIFAVVKEAEIAKEVLGSFDINICRAWFHLENRRVSFPCDSNDFYYVLQRSFYVKLRVSGINFLRVKKYQERGFTNEGYLDDRSNIVHLISENKIVQCSIRHPHHEYFLSEGILRRG